MRAYQVKTRELTGTSYSELIRQARLIFHEIEKQTKRKPYIRSVYFKKEKIFFDFFWDHLKQKGFRERIRRLKFFACAIELIQYSRYKPKILVDPHSKSSNFYRFTGISKEGELFYVQIKENKKTNAKYFMSVFPID